MNQGQTNKIKFPYKDWYIMYVCSISHLRQHVLNGF